MIWGRGFVPGAFISGGFILGAMIPRSIDPRVIGATGPEMNRPRIKPPRDQCPWDQYPNFPKGSMPLEWLALGSNPLGINTPGINAYRDQCPVRSMSLGSMPHRINAPRIKPPKMNAPGPKALFTVCNKFNSLYIGSSVKRVRSGGQSLTMFYRVSGTTSRAPGRRGTDLLSMSTVIWSTWMLRRAYAPLHLLPGILRSEGRMISSSAGPTMLTLPEINILCLLTNSTSGPRQRTCRRYAKLVSDWKFVTLTN